MPSMQVIHMEKGKVMRLTDGELLTTLNLVRKAKQVDLCGPMCQGYEEKLVGEVNRRAEKAEKEEGAKEEKEGGKK